MERIHCEKKVTGEEGEEGRGSRGFPWPGSTDMEKNKEFLEQFRV
uniref:Uncharacterized protein n=1 Tax=Thermosporothrix sp. COM3 TaxID=2490863 RepID=A0A455SK00_9CHLR|nr:hypothetical protein KTC_20310 [Thermosporothrix sp. COM3]BBH87289.1 hypothetical protein KTC_20400 [Thermosporothrix sp. COM3]BBH88143.1 hypothetical protein KTC_28940 [Thermosporothrix sp. COM3]BBH88152.1 hypothetical protein KTC_29030 [Thermosporothrix sp. COM3]